MEQQIENIISGSKKMLILLAESGISCQPGKIVENAKVPIKTKTKKSSVIYRNILFLLALQSTTDFKVTIKNNIKINPQVENTYL